MKKSADLNRGRRALRRSRRSRKHLLGSRSLIRRLTQPGRFSIEGRRLSPELFHPVLLDAPSILCALSQLLAFARSPLLRGDSAMPLICQPTC